MAGKHVGASHTFHPVDPAQFMPSQYVGTEESAETVTLRTPGTDPARYIHVPKVAYNEQVIRLLLAAGYEAVER